MVFQTIDDRKEDKTLARLHYNYNYQTLKKFNELGAGVFFCVNHIADGLARANANVDRIRYNFVDLDDNGINKLEHVLNNVPLPCAIVRTSPGKFHCYWKAVDQTVKEFKAIQKELATTFNTDKSVCDLARVMRLPGYVHHKSEPQQVRWLGSGAYVKSCPSLWREA